MVPLLIGFTRASRTILKRIRAKIAATDETSGDERNQQQPIRRPAGSGKGAQDTTGTTTRKSVAFA
jgi:hypothetical protein